MGKWMRPIDFEVMQYPCNWLLNTYKLLSGRRRNLPFNLNNHDIPVNVMRTKTNPVHLFDRTWNATYLWHAGFR